MPGSRCKIIIDSGRSQAAASAYVAQVAGAERMLLDGIEAKDIDVDDPEVARLSYDLCIWAEKLEAWSLDIFNRATAIIQGYDAQGQDE